MKRYVLCFLIFWGIIPSLSAQDVFKRLEIPSSPNPVGSGARALGMGGAFIAIADDATAASWNPAGLLQLETPEISFVGEYFHRIDDNRFGISPDSNGAQTVSRTGTNYFSAVYPFVLMDRNMVISLNYQHLYDLHRKWNFRLNTETASQDIDYQQEGKLSALGIAYAVQITPKLSVGMTLNIWSDRLFDNKWKQRTWQHGVGTDGGDAFISYSDNYDKYGFSGINANFGVLWNAFKNLTIGAVIKTPFTADLSHEHSLYSGIIYPDLPGFEYLPEPTILNEDLTLKMPMSYGIGLSYRFSDKFSIDFDIYRTEWGDFVMEDSNGRKTSPISGNPAELSDISATNQLRFGAEYLFITQKYVIPVRGGVFYDPAPAEGSPDAFYGISFGTGFGYQRFIFDIAYQYRFGNDAGTDILKDWNFAQDIQEHTLYFSLIVHF